MTVTPHPSASPPQMKSGSSGHEPQLPKSRIEQIRDRFRRHLDDNRGAVTQAKVAKAIGYSDSALTHLLKDSYNGSLTNVALAVEDYLDGFEQERAAQGERQFVRTSIAKRIEQGILMARATRKITVAINDAGVGATETLRQYRDSHEGTVLLECDPSMNSKWALLTELLAVMGAGRMRPADAMREIVSRLQGTDRMLLVDEAHYLTKPECIDLLRRAADRARVALFIGGNEHTYQGRNGGRGAALEAVTGYMQLERRTIRRLRLRASEIKKSDLRMVLSQILPAAVLDDEMLAKFLVEAHTNGGIGRCVAIAESARIIARSHEPQQKHVLRAFKLVSEDEDGGEA